MRTLPREPWRGGQICGWQIAYGLPWSVYCGEYKKTGSPLCDIHDEQERLDNYGILPRFAPGNALGKLACEMDEYDFLLMWEPYEGTAPVLATEKETEAWMCSNT